ncbi:hypothetical protein [Lysobacter sp. A3-1-A15]|uniref:hypothetical protein n=1 Tax=Novilysobacter viscosus TaxID=3098602 RepID=UPI002ED8C528
MRPGSRLVVLADAQSVPSVPPSRWTGLAQHHEVIVLLMTDPLEMTPPEALLPFRGGQVRIELDLARPSQRGRWQAQFAGPVTDALASLPSRGVRVQALSTEAPSESWLPLLGRPRPLVA